MTDARLWHPWLRINRVVRLMLHTRWSGDAWSVVRVEFRPALALTSEIRRAGCLTKLARGEAADLDTFLQEPRSCGDLDSAVEDDCVWMTCTCGAVISRRADDD